jgi:hypothetical protein
MVASLFSVGELRPMTPRAALTQLGKLIAMNMESGAAGEGLRSVGDALAASPGSVGEIVNLIAAESRKKRPNAKLVHAFAFMLGEALVVLRYGVERGHKQAIEEVAAIRTLVQGLADGGKLDTHALLLVLRQFAGAKLELGEALQAAMAGATERHAGTIPVDAGRFEGLMKELSRSCRGDIFAFQAEMSEQAAAFPDEGRAMMAGAMLAASDPAVREAAVAWVLDPGPVTRHQTAMLLLPAAQAGHVSSTMLRRLITIRNWLTDAERPAVDSVIRVCRQKGIEIAPLPPAEVNRIAATAVDGSKAQSFFAVVKDGGKRAVGAVLLKPAGIADAWVNAGLSRAAAERFLAEAATQVEWFESGTEHLRLALGHGLAASRASGVLPPFGLVDVLERTGLTAVQPEAVAAETLIATLLDGVPAEDKAEPMVAKALKASGRWGEAHTFIESWFEDDPALNDLLAGKRLSRKQGTALVLQEHLPSRRRAWAELMAWTALALRQDQTTQDDWLALALVARELLGDRRLTEIPVMVSVARNTAEALQERLS